MAILRNARVRLGSKKNGDGTRRHVQDTTSLGRDVRRPEGQVKKDLRREGFAPFETRRPISDEAIPAKKLEYRSVRNK